MLFKRILNKLYIQYLLRRKPFEYAKYVGVDVGVGTRFMGPEHGMFGTEPFLISIGKNCLITGEVKFLTHDGSVYLLKNKFPKADLLGRIKIGDNVFIGYRTIILPGVTVGSNVVIGAGSVVTRSIPDNSVAVGSPAKVVSSIEDYLNKVEKKIIHTGGLPIDEKKKILERELKKD